MNLLGALLVIAFGFLFVTVSSRLTGEKKRPSEADKDEMLRALKRKMGKP